MPRMSSVTVTMMKPMAARMGPFTGWRVMAPGVGARVGARGGRLPCRLWPAPLMAFDPGMARILDDGRAVAAAAGGPPAGVPLTNAARGLRAEEAACVALGLDGFAILGRRVRTRAGEIDVIAERDGLLVFVEVKSRADLAAAAAALGPRQQARLIAAAELLLGENPGWGRRGVRFDVLLVDRAGRIRRITDAIRQV